MADADISFDSLVGEHVLDGVDTSTESVKAEWGESFEDCSVIRFRLDGIVYCGVEDPSDGYRSSMQHFRVSGAPIANTFPPIRVLALKRTKCEYGGDADILRLVDMVTGKVVVEVGTDNADAYYPSFVAFFDPLAMATNAPDAKAEGRS